MRVLPPIKAIVYFEAVARLLSFKYAAEELCVTPGAVSHQINLLEDFIGQKLLTRHNRTLKLTNMGIRYFSRTSFIVKELEQACVDLGKAEATEIIKIAVPPTLLQYWLLPNINFSTLLNEQVTLEFIDTIDCLSGIENGDIHLAIYYGLTPPDNLYQAHLFDENMIVICSPDHLLTHPIKNEVEYLKSNTLIYTTNRLIQWDVILHQYAINPHLISKKLLFQNSMQAIAAAKCGHGLALVNKCFVQSQLSSGELIEPFQLKPITRKIPAYYLISSSQNRYKKSVINCCDAIMALINKS